MFAVILASGALGATCLIELPAKFGTLNIGPLSVSPPSTFGMNLVLSPSGRDAFVTEPALDRVLVLDTRTGDVVASVRVGVTPTGLAVAPDGKQLWVVDTGLDGTLNSAVTVVSTTTLRVVATVPLRALGGALDVAFSQDGQRAYVTENGIGSNGDIDVVDVATRRVVAAIAPRDVGSFNPTSIAVAPDGEVWVSEANVSSGDVEAPVDDVLAFNPSTEVLQARIPVGRGAFFMALSRDGRFAYVADKETCDLRASTSGGGALSPRYGFPRPTVAPLASRRRARTGSPTSSPAATTRWVLAARGTPWAGWISWPHGSNTSTPPVPTR